MKKKLIIILFIASFQFIHFSCENSENSSFHNLESYNSSLSSWDNLKLKNGSSYEYEIKTMSVFGFGSTTKIIVLNNIVTSRTYELYSLYDEDDNYVEYENRLIINNYSENSDELGSNIDGASPLTIDELYNICLNEYLTVDSSNNKIIFTVNDSNIINNCYYTPNNCQDDCKFGVSLSNFEWLNI